MKIFQHLSVVAATLLLISLQAQAQEQIAVPLSDPGRPGSLHASIIRGEISVSGYKGKEVLIRYEGDGKKQEREVTKNGLRRITNNAAGFNVSEDDNKVEISGVSPLKNIDLQISVPSNFSLYLSAVNGGELKVENVSGEMEISNVNGDIILRNISGSAVVNTVNGDIEASFNRIDANKPMAFSNLNGDIDVSLPSDAKISAKMQTQWGEVYTDFDMDIRSSEDKKVQSSADEGTFKVSVNNWIYGTINGGGPEYMFKSMRGDIYIRKQ